MIRRLDDALRRGLHRAFRNRGRLDELAKCGHPAGARLAAVLRTVLTGDDRDSVLQAMRARRAVLVSDHTRAAILDHGAGRPELDLNPEQMRRGRTVTEDLGELARMSSVPPAMARLLLALVREFRPEHSLELGACVGLSACCIGGALQKQGAGRLLTIEGDPRLADLARGSLAACGIDRAEVLTGLFQERLPEVFSRWPRIDFLFNDGVHEEQTDRELTLAIMDHMPDGAIVLLDDIDWSPGMERFWAFMRGHPRTALSVDLFRSGLLVLGNGPGPGFRVAID
jgi:predicted O-methyltransferase YrrM